MKTAHANRSCFNKHSDLTDTEVIQGALDSGCPKVVIHKGPWKVGPLKLHSDQAVVYRKGCLIEAIPKEFDSPTSCLFDAFRKENIHIEGNEGVILSMDGVARVQHRHGLRFRVCENVVIEGIQIEHTGGDGIYVGYSSKNIIIQDFIISHAYRNGICITGATNVLITRGEIMDTKGTSPQAAIDVEPHEDRVIRNLVVTDVAALNNRRCGWKVYMPLALNNEVIFRNCPVLGGEDGLDGISVAGPYDNHSAEIFFEDCEVSGVSRHAVEIYNRSTTGGLLFFNQCQFDSRRETVLYKMESKAEGLVKHLGGVDFVNCTGLDSRKVVGPLTPEEIRVN